MASHSKGKNPERPGLTSWREGSSSGPPLILSLVQEAVTHSPISELKRAATITLTILRNVKVVKENKDAYERLGDDACGLIVVIWNSYKKAESADEWLSVEMREILEDLTHTLENICSFVQEHISKRKGIRVILGKGDAAKKISEYREHLSYAMQKFELQSQININDVLIQIMRKSDQLSQQILHRNEEEELDRALEIIARNARDHELAQKIHEEEMYAEEVERLREISGLNQTEIDCQDEWSHSEELRRIEKEAKDRKSELERLRAAASAVEEVNRLKTAEEEEIIQLKRRLAAEEDNRRCGTTQAQSSTKNKSPRVEDEIDEEEEEWGGSFIVEAATSEEETEEESPVRGSSKVKKDRSKRRPVDSTDDEEYQHRKSPKTRTAPRKPSSTSLHGEELEDDEDHMPPPSRKSGRANRRPQSLPSHRPLNVDDLMGQINNSIPLGFYGSRSDSHLGSPMYGSLVSFPKGRYGYPRGTIINSGVGNITTSTMANIGNDNSVRKVYRR